MWSATEKRLPCTERITSRRDVVGAARCVADRLPAVGRRVRQAAHVHRSHARISQHVGRQAEGEAGDLGEPVVRAGVVIAAGNHQPRRPSAVSEEREREWLHSLESLAVPKRVDEWVHLHVVGGARVAAHIADVAMVVDELGVTQHALGTHDRHAIVRDLILPPTAPTSDHEQTRPSEEVCLTR